MIRAFVFIAAVVFCTLFADSPTYALKISPFKTSVSPSYGDTTQLFRIENNSPEPAAVQISVLTWTIEPDGSEINQDAEDDFTVFPAQLILQPYESKAVRVQWLGKSDIEKEYAFRVLAEQIPINLRDTPQDSSTVRFLLRFKAALYLTPPDAKSDVIVEKVSAVPESGKLRLHLYNRGTKHTILRNPSVALRLQDGREVRLDQSAVDKIEGNNMHGQARRFFDITPTGIRAELVSTAVLNYESGF